MPSSRTIALVALAIGLLFASPAAAGTPRLGIFGDMKRFDALTGQRSQVGHAILGWGQGDSWGTRLERFIPTLGEMPMVGLGTSLGWPEKREAITPAGIARGKGDAYLVALNRAIAAWGKPIYVRPFGEMNAHWNPYCAYRENGTAKGPSHSTKAFRKAFARVYLLLHGGPAEVDAKLRKLGLPGIDVDLAANPRSMLRVIWNPQGYGSPKVRGNSAQAYYPGDAFVDVVGDDLYDIRGKAEWEAAETLYDAHPSKPFSFPEWGLWGLDDPDFVRRMGRFVRTHPRVEMLAFFNSRPGSIFDLATKPKSRAAYREVISTLARPAVSRRPRRP